MILNISFRMKEASWKVTLYIIGFTREFVLLWDMSYDQVAYVVHAKDLRGWT